MLYDAVALIVSDEGAALLAANPGVRDFVADAFAHCKFVGFVGAAAPLLDGAGVSDRLDDGFVALDEVGAKELVVRCRAIRFWDGALLLPIV